MSRSLVVAILAAALVVSGCANRQPLLPLGEDPEKLVEAIAKRGRGQVEFKPDPPSQDFPPRPHYVDRCLDIGFKVGATCLVVGAGCAMVAGLFALAACAHGNLNGLQFHPATEGGGGKSIFEEIWSN